MAAALAAWQDDLAAALLRSITELPCHCWLVMQPDGELLVPCAEHELHPGLDDEWIWQ